MKKKIALITGGNSSEYIVSLRSADNVANALDKDKYEVYIVRIKGQEWTMQGKDYCDIPVNKDDFTFHYKDSKVKFDAAYIMIHGTPGEDGKLQGYFDMLSIPYSTGGVLCLALTFNKYFCNNYLRNFGLNVADSYLLRRGESYQDDMILKRVGLPCFVKPNDAGSSFGVSKVKTKEELESAIQNAFSEGEQGIIERFIQGTEVTCGVLKTKEESIVMPVTEIVSKNEFFDYEAKYTASKVEEITPARISKEDTRQIQDISSQVYDILSCRGIVRVDFIIENGTPYLLELNTVPGMSAESLIPKQLRAMGKSQTDIFDKVIQDIL